MLHRLPPTRQARLTQSWYSQLSQDTTARKTMKENNPPPLNDEYCARGSALRSRLALRWSDNLSDVDTNQHFTCNLFHACGVQLSILLSDADLACEVLEDVVLRAYGEMEMARERGGEEDRDGTRSRCPCLVWSGQRGWSRFYFFVQNIFVGTY